MKQTKESMARLVLRIEHLMFANTLAEFPDFTNRNPLPAGSEDKSIELPRTSPESIGDSVVGVALI